MAFVKEKEVKYLVQCSYDEKHVFEKVFKVQEGSEGVVSELETFCPHCDKQVMVKVEGKATPSEVLLRTLKRYDME